MRCPTCPTVPAARSASLPSSPAHVSASFETRTQSVRYPASYPRPATGGAACYLARVSCWLSPTGIRFLGFLSRQRIPPFLTVGLPRRRNGTDSVGVSVFRTCETRPGWVPSLLRGGGVVPTIVTSMTGACRFPTASPAPPLKRPIGGGWDHEAYEDSLAFTRPAFPLPVVPGWNEDPSASSLGFAPHSHP